MGASEGGGNAGATGAGVGASEGGRDASSGAGGAGMGTSGGVGTSGAGMSSSGGARDAGAGGAGAGGTGANGAGMFVPTPKPRVLVLTDISNEPDDEESLVRFLVYANEYDVEGLVATTSTWLRAGTREDLIRGHLDAYEQTRPTLLLHAAGFPAAAELRAVTATGQPSYGMAAVGSGLRTAGSDLIIRAADEADERPLWVAVWGGANTLAQAMTDVRASRSAADVDALVAKLRVYTISDQDDAGPWLRREFPNLFYVVSPSDQTSNDYARATWTGISGDQFFQNGPSYQFELVSNAWLTTNVRTGHGALGMRYPQWAVIMEGDTPSFLGLIDNGLGSSVSPGHGGWGGRYVLSTPAGEPRAIWTNSSDTFAYATNQTNTSNQATIWRWRPDYQYDFAARMDWCVASTLAAANHNPIPALNGNHGKAVMTVQATAGGTVALSAEGTSDPDGDTVSIRWYVYQEAGTLAAGATLSTSDGLVTSVALPPGAAGTLHVILDAKDDGVPPLSAYRRAIIDVVP